MEKKKNNKIFSIKKKIFLKNNDTEKTINIEIKATTDHFINQYIIDELERQLFNIDINISEYKK